MEPDSVDAATFERLVAEGRAKAGRGEVLGAADTFEEALALWRGAALEEFEYEAYAEVPAARLEELRVVATEELAEALLVLGRHEELVGRLTRAAEENPLRERLWAQLALALYRSHRQAEALRVLATVRDRLAEELGIDPSAALRRLEQGMLQQRPDLDWSPSASAPTRLSVEGTQGGRGVPGNLPASLTSFVGREEERSELAQLLADARLVTLTGPGGVGKTRLALEVVRQIFGCPDGVWLVELAPLNDPALIANALAQVFGLREQPGLAVIDTLAESLRPRRLLVVLDNCEHLIDGCAALAKALLEACPYMRILATSRVPLRVLGEVVWAVSPLALPDGIGQGGSAELLKNESARLLLERARGVRPQLQIADFDLPAIIALCARLEGIPLAIELAAARASVLSFQQLAARLEDRLRLCTTTATATVPRHRSLEATLEWSYDLLSGPEQALLRALSVFVGGCTLEAVEIVWDVEDAGPNLLDLLGSLVEWSLVMVDHRCPSPRYRLLEVVRQYAAGKLDQQEATARRQRHRDLYLAWAERAEPLAWGDPGSALNELFVELDNFRAALAWSLHGPASDDGGLRLAHALHPLWFCTGLFREGRQWMEAFVARGSRDIGLVSALMRRAGLLARESDDYLAATALTQKALSLARQAGASPRLLARSMVSAGAIAGVVGDFDTERSLLEQALPIARVDDELFVGQCLSFLAYAAHRQARYGEARGLAAEVLAEHSGDWGAVKDALHALGQIEREQGNLVEAGLHLERGFALDVEAGHHSSAHYLSIELGTVAWDNGDGAVALDHYERALELSHRHGARDYAAAAMAGLAEVASADGDHNMALGHVEEAALRAERIGDVFLAASVFNRIADVWAVAGQTDVADRAYRRALSFAYHYDMPWHLAGSLEGLASVALARGQAEEAACLLGAAGAVRAGVGSMPPRSVLPSVEDRTRAAVTVLGAASFEACRNEAARNSSKVVSRYVGQRPTITAVPMPGKS